MAARRLLVATAVTRYPLAPDLDRPELVEDVIRMRKLMGERFGYRDAPVLPPDPAGEQLRTGLRDFAFGECTPEDYVVLYLTGHGDIVERGRHVLLPSDHKPEDVLARGIVTADLARWMLEGTPLRRLMIILDCCYAGQGGKELAREAMSGFTGDGSLVVITATRPHQAAQPGVFTQAFARAAENEGRAAGGYLAPALSCAALVDRVRGDVAVPGFQSPMPIQIGAGEDLHFLPNPEYRPALADLDIDTQESLREELADQLAQRFLPAIQWFTGRQRVLRELGDWLGDAGDDRRTRVVTGNPGSGKTAVLGLLAALNDAGRSAAVSRRGLADGLPPPGAIDAAIYAGTLPTLEVLAAIGAAASIRVDPTLSSTERVRRLATAVRDRFAAGRPLTVLVDALDEAAEPGDLVRSLDALASLSDGHIRLLLGSRAPLLELFRAPIVVIDLDQRAYADPAGIGAYVRTVLLQHRPDGPYRSASEEFLADVADAVGEAAGTSFLVARIITQTLAAGDGRVDPADEAWRRGLPRTAGEAMSRDLSTRLGDQATRAEDLLLPLAYAQGAGLPRVDRIWATAAQVLHPDRGYTDDDLGWLRANAGSYFKEGRGSVYRLFHQSLSEHLRSDRDAAADHAAIAGALLSCVPPAAAGRLDWPDADPYIRANLATHAAGGGRLDDLLSDADFLLNADPGRLLVVLPTVASETAVRASAAYRAALPRLLPAPAGERPAVLQLSALVTGAAELARDVTRDGRVLPWQAGWAVWRTAEADEILTGHRGIISAMAVTTVDGRPVAVVGGDDGTVRLVDLMARAMTGPAMTGHTGPVAAVAVTQFEGVAIALTGGADDGALRLWDLATGSSLGPAIRTGHKRVGSIAVAVADGRPIVITGGGYGEQYVRFWDLAGRSELPAPITTQHRRGISAIEPVSVNGRPYAVTVAGGRYVDNEGAMRLIDLTARQWAGDPADLDDNHEIATVATAEVRGRQIAVTVNENGFYPGLRVWDLATMTSTMMDLSNGLRRISKVVVTRAAGRPVAVCAEADFAASRLTVVDLIDGEVIGEPIRVEQEVHALSAIEIGGRATAVTAHGGWYGAPAAVRLWDLDTDPHERAARPADGPEYEVAAVAVAPSPGPLAIVGTGYRLGKVAAWNLGEGTLAWVAGGHRTGNYTSVRGGLVGGVAAILTTQVDGRPIAVTAGGYNDPQVMVWDAESGQPFIDAIETGDEGGVFALALAPVGGRPMLITAGDGGLGITWDTVRFWDLRTGRPLGPGSAGHRGDVAAIAVSGGSGSPVAITVGGDGFAKGFDSGAASTDFYSVVVDLIEAKASDDLIQSAGVLRVWDLVARRPLGPGVRDGAPLSTVVATTVDGRAVVVTGNARGELSVWALGRRPVIQKIDTIVVEPATRIAAMCVAGNGRGDRLYVAHGQSVEVVAVEPARLRPLGVHLDVGTPVTSLATLGADSVLIGTAQGIVRVDLADPPAGPARDAPRVVPATGEEAGRTPLWARLAVRALRLLYGLISRWRRRFARVKPDEEL